MMTDSNNVRKEIAELRLDIESGDRARKFAESEFYKKDLLPLFEKVQSEAAFASIFSVIGKTPAEIAVNTAMQSGRSLAIEEITIRLNRMIRDSAENIELLKKLEEKLKKLEADKK